MLDCENGMLMLSYSAGFDACEHEQASMQRHARKVPVSDSVTQTAIPPNSVPLSRFPSTSASPRILPLSQTHSLTAESFPCWKAATATRL